MKLPFVEFHDDEGGMMTDPFTDKFIAGVFIFSAPKIISIVISRFMDLLYDEDARCNEAKSLRYGMLERV